MASAEDVTIRALDPVEDLEKVVQFYQDAPDYWLFAEGEVPGRKKAKAFFVDGPPDCDPTKSFRLGLFLEDRLSGLGELSFGFPHPTDAYLGFMMLGPWARNAGHGVTFLHEMERRARRAGAPALYLAVIDDNRAGWAFWARHGFGETGLTGSMTVGSVTQKVHRLVKHL